MPRRNQQPGMSDISAETGAHIIALYNQGHASPVIAAQTGIPAYTVLRYLKAHGIPRRRVSDYNTKHYRGPEHPSWKDGRHPSTYRRIGFEAQGRSCQRCGSTDKLVMHHRNRKRRENQPDNLQPLCRSCHEREHVHERHGGRRRGCSPHTPIAQQAA